MFKIKTRVALLCGCALLVMAQQRGAAQTPVFANGGFEAGNTSSWQVYNPAGRLYTFTAASNPTLVHSGNRAGVLSLFNSVDDQLLLTNTTSITDTPAGALFQVSLWMRFDNIVMQNPAKAIAPVLAATDSSGNVLSYGVAGSFSGNFPYVKMDFLLEKPLNATGLQCRIVIDGGFSSGRLMIDDLTVTVLPSAGPAGTAGLLDARVTPDAGGTPRLTINGQAESPAFFFGNSGGAVIYDEIEKAAGAGVRLIELGFQLPWEGFSTAQMTAALTRQPNALFVPRINLQPSTRWLARHPLPMAVGDDGTVQDYPSIASDDLMTAWKHQLDLLIPFLNSGGLAGRVIGYHPGYLAGGEWFHGAYHYYDYSEVNRSRFQAWVMARYRTLGALNTAWAKSLASFNAVTIPPTAEWEAGDDGVFRDPATRTWVTDYQLYYNNLVADLINELCQHIKQLTDDKALTFAFYGYQFELLGYSGSRSVASSGHLAMRRILDAPYLDVMCSPISYVNRFPGAASELMGPVDSVTLANKLQLQEDDSRTHLWISPPPDPGLAYPTEADTLNCLRRNFGNVLGHNLGIWWMDLTGNGNFNGPSIWDTNKQLKVSYDQTVRKALPFRPQVALIYDEDSAFWLKGNSYDLNMSSNQMRTTFQQLGAQVGFYLVEDINRLPASVRLIVMNNTFRLTAAERALVEQAKSGRRTILWMYAPGYVTETALSVGAMSTLTGFTLQRLAGTQPSNMTVVDSLPALTGNLAGYQLGVSQLITPLFAVDAGDSAATTLATYNSGGARAMAVKDFGTWRSVFCGAPLISTVFARQLALYAGVVLAVDSQAISNQDAIQTNDDFLYVYARNTAGKRAFQLPFELTPNGGFERDTEVLPTSGTSQWITLASGALTPSIAADEGYGGGHALKIGTFANLAGSYVVPVLIRLPNAVSGRTYRFSAKLRLNNLQTAEASVSSYIYLQVSPVHYSAAHTLNFTIAEGASAVQPLNQWITLTGN